MDLAPICRTRIECVRRGERASDSRRRRPTMFRTWRTSRPSDCARLSRLRDLAQLEPSHRLRAIRPLAARLRIRALGIALGMKEAAGADRIPPSPTSTRLRRASSRWLERLLTSSGRPFSVSLGPAHPARGLASPARLFEGLAGQVPCLQGAWAPRPIGVLQGLAARPPSRADVPAYKAIRTRASRATGHMRDPAFRANLLRKPRAAALGHGGRLYLTYDLIFLWRSREHDAGT